MTTETRQEQTREEIADHRPGYLEPTPAMPTPGVIAPFRFGTTELPLATKLYMDPANQLLLQDTELVLIRGKPLTKWWFKVKDPASVDDFKTGKDQISNYETGRKFMLRVHDELIRQAKETSVDEVNANQGKRPQKAAVGA